MYEDYQFVMEWNELPEDYRQEKIEEYIEKCWRDGEYQDEKGNKRPLDEVLQDYDVLQEAERQIEAHFPIYF